MLGLDEGADTDEILTARRRLARELHPDRGGDLDQMQLVNWAADTLLRSGDTGAGQTPEPSSPGSAAALDDEPFDIDLARFVVQFSAPLVLIMAAVMLGSMLAM